ncbi:unnamed protein product [Cylindrotheca closterium]|uniref:Uncharacterized protein n=1 Tax=Cylindrotheca closterium TaxID=2856 RepID=A0AAD2JPZ5_9STRA|nr:unnamed protein product [Cylindrotheca closterium]
MADPTPKHPGALTPASIYFDTPPTPGNKGMVYDAEEPSAAPKRQDNQSSEAKTNAANAANANTQTGSKKKVCIAVVVLSCLVALAIGLSIHFSKPPEEDSSDGQTRTLRFLDYLETMDNIDEALQNADPEDLDVFVEGVRSKVDDEFKSLITPQTTLAAWFPNPSGFNIPEVRSGNRQLVRYNADVLTTSPSFSELSRRLNEKCLELLVEVITNLVFLVFASLGLGSFNRVFFKNVASSLVEAGRSVNVFEQLLTVTEFAQKTGSKVDLLKFSLELGKGILSTTGLNFFWKTFKENVTPLEAVLVGAETALTITAFLATGGLALYAKLASVVIGLGLAIDAFRDALIAYFDCMEDESARPTMSPSTLMPTMPSTLDSFKTTRGTSDPHFSTWNGFFSYQGACDLVYIDTDLIKVHVRTTLSSTSTFSYISAVAVSLGGDIFEFNSNDDYFVNKEKSPLLPSQIGGYPLLRGFRSFSIDLGGGQSLRVSIYQSTLTVDVTGHIDNFGDSKGISGSFHQNSAVKRDGSLFSATDPAETAAEWLVDSGLGDELLFTEPSPHEGCIESTPFTYSDAQRDAAREACSEWQGASFENCIFDVLASGGNTDWASNPGFGPVLEMASCPNENKCLNGTVNLDGFCEYTAFACSNSSKVCDPYDGICKTQSDIVPCVAVIDESSLSNSQAESKWAQFRKEFPRRPFCLLRPPAVSGGSTLHLPSSFDEDPLTLQHPVNRDSQYNLPISDWFNLCGLDLWAKNLDFIALFLDTSGSVKESHVKGSLDFFVDKAQSMGLKIRMVKNGNENWIDPFTDEIMQAQATPQNDECGDASTLSSLPITLTDSTFGAFPDFNLGNCSVALTANGAWYSYTATEKKILNVVISAPNNVKTVLSVFAGDCNNFSCKGQNGPFANGDASLAWITESGVTYKILVSQDNFGLGISSFDLSIQDYDVPDNDSCEGATSVETLPFELQDSTVGALPGSLPDANMTTCLVDDKANGIWYSYTANAKKLIRAYVSGPSRVDTVLRVFSGDCTALSCIGKDGPYWTGDAGWIWIGEAGVTYKLLVSEDNFGVGISSFDLSIQDYDVPDNDSCDGATSVDTLPFELQVSSVGALPDYLPDSNLTTCLVDEEANGIWYSYTATATRSIRAYVSGPNTADTVLRVFSGDCTALSCIGKDGPYWTGDAGWIWIGEAGVTYKLLVSEDNFGVGISSFDLSIQDYDVPDNDLCDSATSVETLPFELQVSSVGALPDSLPDSNVTTCLVDEEANGIWYSYTATATRSIRAYVSGPNTADTVLRVFSGDCTALSCIGKDGPYWTGDAGWIWIGEAGVTYKLLVSEDNFGVGISSFDLSIQDYDVPDNDLCDSATSVDTLPFELQVSSVGALPDSLPDSNVTTCLVDEEANGIWYSYTATATRSIRAYVSGPNTADTVLRVFSGDCTALSCIGKDGPYWTGDAGWIWIGEAGVTYKLLVSEDNFGVGISSFDLSIQDYDVPDNDSCDGATSVDTLPFELQVSSVGALRDSLPDSNVTTCLVDEEANGIWYSYTATATRSIRAYVSGPNTADTVLRVFSGDCTALSCIGKDGPYWTGDAEVIWIGEAGVTYKLLVSEDNFGVGISSCTLSLDFN